MNKARSKFRITNTQAAYIAFNKLKNRVKQIIRTSAKKFMHNLISTKTKSIVMWLNLINFGFIPSRNSDGKLAVTS